MVTTTAIDTLLRQPAAQALSWALLQFVWQGAAIAAVTAVALAILRRSAADVRYIVASIGLSLMLTLPIVTGVQTFQSLSAEARPRSSPAAPAAVDVRLKADAATAGHPEVKPQPDFRGKAEAENRGVVASAFRRTIATVQPDGLIPLLMLIWAAGVTVLSLRLLTGWLWIQRMRTHRVSPVETSWERMAARLARQLHIGRAVTLLDSALVDVPTVIGWLKPVVLLPASALGALTPLQVEAILAHELAHIRRHDYLVNLMQTVVETLLFYHPAVWWLSRRIRIERENCCDDLAVSLCGDPIAYANALADLESLRSTIPPFRRLERVAMAATGGSLLLRVRRLLGAPSSHAGARPAWLAGSAALVLAGGIALGATDLGGTETASQAQPAVAVPVAPAAQTPSAAVAVPRKRAVAQAAIADPRDAGKFEEAARAIVAESDALKATAARLGKTPAAAIAVVEPGTPAVAAVAASGQSISHQSSDDSHGNWIWSNNGEKLEVSYRGSFDFTDDDTDVREISTGGYLKISDGAWLGRHSVEIRENNGRLEHRYYVNTIERPYEPEGRVWLQQNLPKFVRNTGIGAPKRVARFLKSGGVGAVTAEIGRIDSTYVKGIYFRELFRQASLTPDQYRQAMAQASREMKSDYELAQLLIAVSDRLPNDEASRAAYFDAASHIKSDYETRRVYSAMLKRGPVSSQVLSGILDHAKTMRSDYELAELLRQVLSQQTLDDRNRGAFFAAVAAMHSDYERHRALRAVISDARPIDPALLEAALTQAEKLSSDYEAATFLLEVLRQNGVEGPARAAFFRVVGTLHSGYERGRVLQAVVRKPGVSSDTLRAVLQSTHGMGGYELSQLLIALAGAHVLNGDLREAYLDAADRLASYEQGQVMSALVKSERRK